ncbi:RNA-directed DNA polymerase, eukaryota [Tanacetum coccineum]
MGSFRSKEDDVAKISLSVFITNFPDSCAAKDLFHHCKQYGHVVDSFIPNKRSKVGNRFGFVRFINVFNEEILVNNLCTVWIGRHKLYANLAKFKGTPASEAKILTKNEGSKMGSTNYMKKQVDVEKGAKPPTSSCNSFAQAVIGDKHSGGVEIESCPAVVLDDECLGSKDLSKSLFGRVKEFASLANLKVALCNEGFVDIKIIYMGELWVMLEFGSPETIKLFRDNLSVRSWFSCIKQAVMDFVVEERIAWVEIEGIPFKLWSNNTFKRIANRWGVLLDIDDQEEACYHSKRLCIHMKSGRNESEDEEQEDEMSKDGGFNDHVPGSGRGDSELEEVPETLFKNEGLVQKSGTEEQEIKSEDPFLIYPLLEKKINHEVGIKDVNVEEGRVYSAEVDIEGSSGKHINRSSKEDCVDSVVSGHFKKSTIPRTGGSIVGLLDEMVKVGQVMGYNMEGCKSNMANIIRSQGAEEETKMENMNLLCVRMCWGNLAFEYAQSDSVGNSGGILCVWDPNSFSKHSVTSSDYFVMVRGAWRSTGQLVLLISIYAPQDVSEKQMLWNFLQWEISKWNGDVVIIGDFNEVRYKSDRFGFVFNAHGASLFNSFISNSGLVEVKLGGSSFTWCHKSASKMSKLDRFTVSESFLNNCPNINAITLERFMSDHRPILLRESKVDYGPTPFCFFHHWIEMDGFCKVVEDGWKESSCDSFDAMRNLMGKLKYLKKVIRVWNKSNSLRDSKAHLKTALEAVDIRIDNGHGTEEDSKSRVDFLSKIQDIDKLKSIEMAQKTKVKWVVEGDENFSFFHDEISEYVSLDQQSDMECDVSNAEIKKAAWDCGLYKAPGPDGFSFDFYRRFWNLIEKDVCDAVRCFFIHGEFSNGCNSSFIALIPKIPDANMVKDFRPISLVGSLYKIITKILMNRLVGVSGDIVSDVQSAFIAERQILDGPFILNEVLQWCKVKKKQALIFKVDFEKAYDSVSSPTLEFQFGKGLKQGDPLAPFLFIMIMESLHLSFQRVVDAAKIMGVHVKSDKVNMAVMKLGCLVLKTPFIYLGSMVGGAMSKASAWSEVVDKVKNRLSKWKMKTLSFGGRLTLLKSVLGSIPIFHMSMFKVPSGVLNSLESLRSHFFNGHDINSRKASWVKWKSVLAHKERGGLGVSSFYALNKGLLFKWIWRFYSKKSSLWSRVIKAIHGVDGKVYVITRAGKRSCWLNIIHEVNALINRGIDLKKYMRIKLGDGANTAFWEDSWSEGGKLKYKFPRLFALEECKTISVELKLGHHSLTDYFRRIPRGGAEQHQFDEMAILVNSISLAPMSDRLCWDLESSGDFTVAFVRKLIDDIWLPSFDSKTRWVKYVPIKINVHAWKVMTDSIPTRFNISRRGICIDSIRMVELDG